MIESMIRHRARILEIFQEELRVWNLPTLKVNSGFRGICKGLEIKGESLYFEVIRYWFTPERFGIDYLYSRNRLCFLDEDSIIRGDQSYSQFRSGWYRYNIEDILKGRRHVFYWFPVESEFNDARIKILEKAIEMLKSYGED